MAFPIADLVTYAAPWALAFGLLATMAIHKTKKWEEQEHLHLYAKITENLHKLAMALHKHAAGPSGSSHATITIMFRELEETLEKRNSMIQAYKEPAALHKTRHALQRMMFTLMRQYSKILKPLQEEMDLKFIRQFMNENPAPQKVRRVKKLRFP